MRSRSTLVKRHINRHETSIPKEPTSEMSPLSDHHGIQSKWIATMIIAAIYILSGATQPLLMTLVKNAGLGDKICQVYMLGYYLGPALVSFTLCSPNYNPPPSAMLIKASAIALIDIIAQATNYTGATMAGPTIFAIIYSSVTVWTAVYSRILLGRRLRFLQWIGILVVFGGLAITATNSVSVGPDVFQGALLVVFGSSLHAMTYVLSEAIMVKESLSVQMNCAVQGIVACGVFLSWQLLYTRVHFHDRLEIPMANAGTSIPKAIGILLSLSASNLVHALSFFYTLKHFPGGATSAGVMKSLQAVLVFVFSSIVYCGSIGGDEMCFSVVKLISLLVVIGGVLLFMTAAGWNTNMSTSTSKPGSADRNGGYTQVGEVEELL